MFAAQLDESGIDLLHRSRRRRCAARCALFSDIVLLPVDDCSSPCGSVRDGKHNTAVAGSLVDMVVRYGDVGERVSGRDGNVQRAGSGGLRQINSGLLLGFNAKVIAAEQPQCDVGEQQWPKRYFGAVGAARVGRNYGIIGHDRGVQISVIG
jgi:hypothetical protein